MSILVLNVRRLNDKVRRKDVKDHISKYNPSLVAFVETKVSLANVQRLTSCVYQNWQVNHNFDIEDMGRIWISWDPRVWRYVVISKSYQQLTLSHSDKGGFLAFLTIVYGENVLCRRESLWKDLQHMQGHPWLVAGDFNTARNTNEKVGGRTVNIFQLTPFNDYITHCNLSI